MIGSLFAGISGLNANATAMTVIGDNIANVNTSGFKTNRAQFANILSQSLGDSATGDIGRGAEFWGTSPLFTQGSLENTASPTDLAINGKGFFMVQDDTGANYFTRAGQFFLNEVGDMVNPDDLNVQGYAIDPTGNLGNIEDISIPGERMSPPSATTEFTFDINLDAASAVGETYSASQSVFDSLGNALPFTLTFENTGIQTWDMSATVAGTGNSVNFNPAAVGGPFNTISLSFDTSGNLLTPDADQVLEVTLATGAVTPQLISWDLIDNTSGSNLGDITGYTSPSTTTFQYQDGYVAGVLRGISVDEDGIVTASYSNGQLIPVFQVALADFPSYDGLKKLGKNLYSESINSGQAMTGVAGNGRLGSISPMSIEMSNVDLAQEFVKMITTQRAFQANSRVITTSDEILAELINLKR
jgi:flagellar hook protein FlgE